MIFIGSLKPLNTTYSDICGIVRGRWSGKSYICLKKLGAGSTGETYLVRDDCGKSFAMKVSRDLVSITKEYGYLERFRDMGFAPKAYQLDDFEKDNVNYHYIVMELVEGETLKEALSKQRLDTAKKLELVRVIADLMRRINDQGFVYTDLKYENLMIDRKNGLIRLIDLGSITPIGARVKEYTPMYDRLSWHAGGRTADLTYQVFSVMILMLSMLLSRDINPEREQLVRVVRQLERSGLPGEILQITKDCLEGRISDCGRLFERLGDIDHRGSSDKRLTHVLNAVIALLSLLLAVLIRTVFA